MFSKRSAAVIDGSEKRNGSLNFERQSPHVIERRSKLNFSTLLQLQLVYLNDRKNGHLYGIVIYCSYTLKRTSVLNEGQIPQRGREINE